MAIYLGATQISSNPTGTGKLILGTQNICKAYLGSTLIFDNCAVANTNVKLQYTGSYGGNATGVIVENPVNNHVISGQPGDTGTLTLSTPTFPSGGYNCTGGCPDVNPKSIAYTFPTSGTTTINSTRSGGLNSNVANGTITLIVKINNADASLTPGVSYNVTPSQSITQPVNDTVTFRITFSINTNYSGSVTGPGGSSSPYDHDVIIPAGTNNTTEVNLTANNVTENTYQLNAGTFSYSGVTGGTVNSAFTAATLTNSAGVLGGPEVKASGATYTFTQGGLAPISSYTWASGDPTVTYTIQGGSASLSAPMDPNYGGQSINGAVSGTLSVSSNSINIVGTTSYSCANNACINASGSNTSVWFAGSLPGTLYEDQALTIPFSYGNNYYKISTGGALFVNAGSGSQVSCVSTLYLFSNTSYAAAGYNGYIAACNGSMADNYYGTTGTLTTSQYIYNGNDGCTGTSGYVSDGVNWVLGNASGLVINTGPC